MDRVSNRADEFSNLLARTGEQIHIKARQILELAGQNGQAEYQGVEVKRLANGQGVMVRVQGQVVYQDNNAEDDAPYFVDGAWAEPNGAMDMWARVLTDRMPREERRFEAEVGRATDAVERQGKTPAKLEQKNAEVKAEVAAARQAQNAGGERKRNPITEGPDVLHIHSQEAAVREAGVSKAENKAASAQPAESKK